MAKTITLNASPTWPGVKDDYSLRYEGHAIGRIRRAEKTWEWQITIPMAMPTWASGSGASLDECRQAFAAAWGRFLKETNPARLERAWELQRSVEARQQRMEAAAQGALPRFQSIPLRGAFRAATMSLLSIGNWPTGRVVMYEGRASALALHLDWGRI